MNSQRSSCLGCFSGSELAQSGPIWSVGRWVNRTHPHPLSLLPLSPKEKHAAVFSTFQNTAAMQQSVQKHPGACQTCTDTARLLALGEASLPQ